MKPIAIFGAMYMELKPLLRRVEVTGEEKAGQIHFFDARWRGIPLVVVRTGVGKSRAEAAARALLRRTKPSLGLSAGLCGAVAPELKVGETLVAKGISPELASFDAVLGKKEKEALRRNNPRAKACDMETAFIARVFEENKIPFAAVRTVSDRWDREFPPREILIQKNTWKQIVMLIAHYQYRFPVEFFRLLKLGWDARRAAKINARETLKFILFSVDTVLKKT